MRLSRSLLFLPLLVFLCAALYSQSQTTKSVPKALTNQDVVEMLKAGLSQEIVIAKIKASVCDFDTLPTTLKQLKAEDVPDSVILAMVQAPPIRHINQNESRSSFEEQEPSIRRPELPVVIPPDENGQPISEIKTADEVYAKCDYGPIAIYSGTISSSIVATVVCGDALAVLEKANGEPGKPYYLFVRTQRGIEGYLLPNFVSKTKTEIRQINAVANSVSASKPSAKPCNQPPWPSGQIWDLGSLAYDSVGLGNTAAKQLLTNASKYYLLSSLPEEGDPPIGWWTKVPCPEDADIWIFAKSYSQYSGPLQPNAEVYHVLIASPQPAGWMVYNHVFLPEGSLWTPLEQTAEKLRDSAARKAQKQLNKQHKEDAKTKKIQQ